jgi:hypothetical protein
MKSTLVRSGLLAVTAVLFSAATYAQASSKLVADINFNFRSGGTDFAAGRYDVTVLRDSGTTKVIVQNEETHKSALFVASYALGRGNTAEPRLVFACNPATCGLAEVWTLETGYRAPGAKLSAAENERIAVVPMKSKRHVAD